MSDAIELKRGLKANLPATGTHIGEPFFCTDTDELFIWDGHIMAKIGGTIAGGFGSLATGENTTAVMTVGSGAQIIPDPITPGVINATEINGIPITGSLTHAGQIPISQPGNTSAVWADPLVQGLYVPGANVTTANPGSTPINPVLIGAANPSSLLKNLSVDASGNLLVAVGGTMAVTQSTSPWVVSLASTTVTGTVAVSGTVTANVGTTGGLALDATLTGGTQKTKLVDSLGTNLATISAAGAVKVDGSAVTQPVSGTGNFNVVFPSAQHAIIDSATLGTVTVTGTVTANAGTGTFNTTDANAQTLGSTTVGQKGFLELGAVTTAAPTYITAQSAALSLNTAGGLRVDGSGVTQPVSLTSTTITGTVAVSGTVAATQSGTWNIGTVTAVTAITNTVTVAGTVTANAGTGTFNTTDANAQTLGSTTAGQKGFLELGAVTTAAPVYTTAQSAALSLNTAGGLRVDGSGVTQPVSLTSTTVTGTVAVSGTVTANIGTTNGLALDATLTGGTQKTKLVDTGGVNVASISAANALKVDGSAVTQPVSLTSTTITGTVAATQSGTWNARLQDGAGTALTSTLNTAKQSLDVNITGGSSGNGASSATAAAVPTQAGYTGLNIAGNLVGLTGLSLTNSKPATVAIVDGTGTQITSFGGGTQFADAAASGATPTGTLSMGWDSVNSKIRGLKVNASQALVVDGSAVTQPVSLTSTTVTGTVAVTQSTSPWVTSDNNSATQGSTTSGQKGFLEYGAVTTAAPTYITAQSNALSLNTAGGLRVDGSGVTQPVSLTSTTITGTVAATQSGTWNVGTLTSITNTVVVSGTVTANAGTGTFTTSDANAQTLGSTTSGQKGFLELGAVTTAAPTYTTAQSAALSLNTAGGLRVDGSGVTQPVSLTSTTITGTVAATQSGTWNVGTVTAVTAITNALPAGTNLIGQASASQETGTVYNGTTALTPLFANIVASASGVTNLVALVTSKKIRVLALSFVANGAVNIKFQSHVTPTDISGLYYLAANGGIVLPHNPLGWFQTVSGEALDINLSAAVSVGGNIVYVTV